MSTVTEESKDYTACPTGEGIKNIACHCNPSHTGDYPRVIQNNIFIFDLKVKKA